MDWIIWVILGLVALPVWGFISNASDNAEKTGIINQISADLPDGTPVLVKKATLGATKGLAITGDTVLLIDGLTRHRVDYDDLISAEIITDGATINQTSRVSQVAGGLVGAAIAGPAGAIIGGLGASSRSSKAPPKQVKLRLTLADIKYPKFDIDFIEMTNTGNTLGAIALEEAETWLARLQGVIHIAHRLQRKIEPTN
ncbi:hypothetical protein [uncultured Parasphingorhabdus sp.]|uniref:hypothetical protein n=1 Tax=uncultured Parasphingorhabdus sp. TaxID=2709694 RepID=UPI002AA8BAF4|nr:hypothetical protein [uncultured Parasphingorhabdus sp.]